ncbi:putative protein s-acyltransferase 22 [Quercus suber]|uniref:Uncharacterized protein n=1 Tax=Quercus suber TaxID=58331 RepID=A0AAW0J4E0_QUESU
MVLRPDNNRRRANKRMHLLVDLPVEPLPIVSAKALDKGFSETSTSLAPLQLEARSAFQTSRAMSSSARIVASSLESRAEEARQLTNLPAAAVVAQRGLPLSRSTSDGYEAFGGEYSDRVPSRTIQRSTNWSNLLFGTDHDERVIRLNASSSSQANNRKL